MHAKLAINQSVIFAIRISYGRISTSARFFYEANGLGVSSAEVGSDIRAAPILKYPPPHWAYLIDQPAITLGNWDHVDIIKAKSPQEPFQARDQFIDYE